MTDHIKAISELEAEIKLDFRIVSNGESFTVEERGEELRIFSKNRSWWSSVDGAFRTIEEAQGVMRAKVRTRALHAHGYHPVSDDDVYLPMEDQA